MEHQDHTVVILRGKSKLPNKKVIKPKNHVDLHAIKIENEQENFTITTIPKKICNQIAQARNSQKMTQKDMAQRLGIQQNIYVTLENGKAQWNGPTKQMVNKIENVLKVKFQR
jgi:ribosome-binding protein aMBF1 (putative translation factor)